MEHFGYGAAGYVGELDTPGFGELGAYFIADAVNRDGMLELYTGYSFSLGCVVFLFDLASFFEALPVGTCPSVAVYRLITAEDVGQAAHIAGALYVVLTAQGVHAGVGCNHIVGEGGREG
ncbi:hypothetical protein HKBW3S42_01624 [Candidatus Hakubella thermalkaliphila]|uniref:Uncharacterized protein n=1 Tax=Candidatus Hakubella thermalkaliphila TaxID=2754717 RepID=A0A6V8PMC6_9ACTN|nr:hypothetical protein HKBW3S42_01624 [Candidatus Hakubella thermalkaliphila]